MLYPALWLAASAAGCSLLQNECDAGLELFFFNLRQLVKTLKQ